MKLTTLGWVAHSLENMVYEIKVSEEVREKAKRTLDRMLQVTGEKKGAAIAGY
jgi:quinolinate synthase